MSRHPFRSLLLAALAVIPLAARAAEPPRLPADKLPKIKLPADVRAFDQPPIRVKVVVLEFNPIIPPEVHSPGVADAKPQRLVDLAKYPQPLELAAGYMQDICDASGGFVRYEIVEWIDTQSFHVKTDGFNYTPQSYWECRTGKAKWHEPDGADYAKTFADYKLLPRIESGEIDEVWFFGGPYFGYWESAMAGKDAFYINGGVLADVPCKRRFAIMGFNYERGVAEMIHDLCHRTESTMSRVYGGWKCEELTTPWARFAANAKQSGGEAACGTCHYPPNAEKDYDYANPRVVQSSAEDWLNYPKLTGTKKPVSCETWAGPYKSRDGKPDYHRNYMRWWFTHLPKGDGAGEDGRQNNWWKYVFAFDRYDERGGAVRTARP